MVWFPITLTSTIEIRPCGTLSFARLIAFPKTASRRKPSPFVTTYKRVGKTHIRFIVLKVQPTSPSVILIAAIKIAANTLTPCRRLTSFACFSSSGTPSETVTFLENISSTRIG